MAIQFYWQQYSNWFYVFISCIFDILYYICTYKYDLKSSKKSQVPFYKSIKVSCKAN